MHALCGTKVTMINFNSFSTVYKFYHSNDLQSNKPASSFFTATCGWKIHGNALVTIMLILTFTCHGENKPRYQISVSLSRPGWGSEAYVYG